MIQTKKSPHTLKIDFVTVLIILFFLALTFGVYLYYKHRISEIQNQLKQSYFQNTKGTFRSTSVIGYSVTLVQ